AQRESAEGLGCRYYLAIARRQIGFGGLVISKKDNKIISINANAKLKLESAQLIFKEIADSENEYADRAARNRSQILVIIADAEGHGDMPPLSSLPNFERAYLMAQVQIARFGQFVNAPKEEPKKEEPKKEEPKGKQ